ncbi:hypothetical protein [Actinoplanes friuliensis]|uniref:Uncharacterized protein n=1 Tax=Actinoplanes friuliensis DSM 7358 TaxID=1246995 RepID=U5W4Q8_9ACTN|nr:hypothetical protein [Actinoplanes friuliensis]AGZ44183.1 hypothetical protein AFR_29610 [Actinoplanes friuliensis DSM 7358]
MPLLAGAVDVDAVMASLSSARRVFHSEADFQHAFAWVLHEVEPSLNIRLEVRQDKREYVDLFCFGPKGRTAVEFKYFTARWDGTDSATEKFHLRGHAATDLARRNFVFDIARLERFCASGRATNGFAIMVSNDRRLWEPIVSRRVARDQEFRIDEGRALKDVLRWGTEGSYFDANQRELAGSYSVAWRDFSELNGPAGDFHQLILPVEQRAQGVTRQD